jgi:hypothetical protein
MNSINILAVSLITVETLMIGYAYFSAVSYMALGVASIYLILALADFIVKNNKVLTYFVVFVSIFISIPRAIIQIDEAIEVGRQAELEKVKSIPLPEKRKVEVSLLDCSRIPYWQGNLQIDCSNSNNKQIESQNEAEVEYKNKLEKHNREKAELEEEIKNSSLKYVNLKIFSTILLVVFITPILPITVILLIHNKTTVLPVTREARQRKPKKTTKLVIDETTKERAISMLKLGYSVAEIEEELGISRPTLYRYKKIIK